MKVLIIQQKMIGDVLTSSILFEALRNKYPEAELHYIINSHTFPVVEHNSFIDKFIFITPKIQKSKLKFWGLLKSIRNENYDIVIDVYSKLSSNLITIISGAKTKISKYKWYTSFIYTNTFKEQKSAKTNAGLAIENRLQLLQPLFNEKHLIIRPKIYLTSKEIEASKKKLTQSNINLSKPLFMISVLGSSKNKTYPFPYMAKLIDTIVSETKGQILFNYIPKQEAEALIVYNFCKKETQQQIHFNVFGQSLREFLAITKHCDALIGNEGGASNMAKALDIPTFTIFSPWIRKDAWNMFEDGKTHFSIHLRDVKPELYDGKPLKKIKNEVQSLYEAFLPESIFPKLKSYLKHY